MKLDDYYICKFPSAIRCECILHPHCFEEIKESVNILAKCNCHSTHVDSFVHVQVEAGTSEDKKISDSQEHPADDEDEKNSDSQEHPADDDMVWHPEPDGYRRMKRSEMLKLQQINDSKGVPRYRC
jgi:hypothetical protein